MKLTPYAFVGGFVALVAANFQGTGSRLLNEHTATLQSAGSLTVDFSLQPVPGTPVQGKLIYSKPSMVRLESPFGLTVSDGKTLWEYSRRTHTYTETPASPSMIQALASQREVSVWAGFFSPDPFNGVVATLGEKKMLRGSRIVEVAISSQRLDGTVYVDEALGIARGGSIRLEGLETFVFAKQITLSPDPIPASSFAFTPPSGARKVDKKVDVPALVYADVAPILARHCAVSGCHVVGTARGGLALQNYHTLMAGGRSGRAVIPRDAQNSILIKYVEGRLQPKMPIGGSLSSADISLLRRWITEGARQR